MKYSGKDEKFITESLQLLLAFSLLSNLYTRDETIDIYQRENLGSRDGLQRSYWSQCILDSCVRWCLESFLLSYIV